MSPHLGQPGISTSEKMGPTSGSGPSEQGCSLAETLNRTKGLTKTRKPSPRSYTLICEEPD